MNITLRLDSINPVHARVSLFVSGKRYGVETTSRGLAGDLCIDAETLVEFIERLQPNRITLSEKTAEYDATTINTIMPYIGKYNELHEAEFIAIKQQQAAAVTE